MKIAKKRHFKKTPEFWKVLTNNPKKKSHQEEWEEMWAVDMQKFYKAKIVDATNIMNKIVEESMIDTCQNKDHLSRLSENIGLTQLPPKT